MAGGREFFVFAALLAAALFLEFWQRDDDNAALFAGAVPTAVIVLDTVPTQPETELCYYRYQPLTPFPEPGNRFLYDDTEEVKISAAEKIDAEYLAQALFTDEEETDISYRIAGMVENGVSTGVSTADGIWDVLCHVEKMTWPIASLMSFMRRNCPKTKFETNFPILAMAILYITATRTLKTFMLP